jgi:hypothetical protein
VYAVVDRKPTSANSVPSPDGGFAVRLPPGRNTVTISFAGPGGGGGGAGGLLVVVIVVLVAVGGTWGFLRFRRH